MGRPRAAKVSDVFRYFAEDLAKLDILEKEDLSTGTSRGGASAVSVFAI
jgi:hypothetical protein